MDNLIIATNWEEVKKDEFLLSKEWEDKDNKEAVKKARKLQKKHNLYYAYLVDAKDLCIYKQLEGQEILIDEDLNIILEGEMQVINANFSDKYSYK